MPSDAPVPLRLLLVEDEALIRMIVVEILTDDGYEVAEAASAGEAMDHLNACGLTATGRQFDAAIIDVGLPDRPGDVLAEEIRARWPNLPVVIASGLDSAKLAPRFAGDTGIAVVGKPYTETALYDALVRLGVKATPAVR